MMRDRLGCKDSAVFSSMRRSDGDNVNDVDLTTGDDMHTMAQRMRMLWWRNALKELHGGTRHSKEEDSFGSISRHPVGRDLGQAILKTGITRRFLDRLVDARQDDLERCGEYPFNTTGGYGDWFNNIASIDDPTECHGRSCHPSRTLS